MAFERLRGGARRCVPEPHRSVVRGRRDQLAVWREGDGTNGMSMAFECLQQWAPLFYYLRTPLNPIEHLSLKLFANYTPLRCEYKGTAIYLQRCFVDN